jgi:hypothetical protein
MPRSHPIDDELLDAIRRELARLRAIDPRTLSAVGGDRFARGEIRQAAGLADEGIVTARFEALLGRGLSDAERKALQRSAIRLEGAGKLRRFRLGYDGIRTTHLQLVEDDPAPDRTTKPTKAPKTTPAKAPA